MLHIRKLETKDWEETWKVLQPVFKAGNSYPFDPDINSDEAYQVWVTIPQHTYLAFDKDNRIVGSYYIKPNQPDLGAHVCNCGYVVAKSARDKGVGSALYEHSEKTAISLGYRAIQFNLVVKSNQTAVKLWQKHGFEIVGTLPKAFNHKSLGYVDAYVMYKQLNT